MAGWKPAPRGVGITLSHWFANEARRVHAMLCETREDASQLKLIQWLHRHGGQASARDLARSSTRRYSTAEQAQLALDQLAEVGLGSWQDVPAGILGRPPKQVFVLSDQGPASRTFVGHSAQHPLKTDLDDA